MILEKHISSFCINSTPNVINKKSSDLFPKIYKATFGYNWLDTRLHIFDSFWLDVQFFTAVILLYYLYSVIYCSFKVVISVITMSSNYARSVKFTALLFESPFTLMKAYCQLAETSCRFQSFTTVEERLLLSSPRILRLPIKSNKIETWVEWKYLTGFV